MVPAKQLGGASTEGVRQSSVRAREAIDLQ
jgi:hypothetical protein